MKILDKINDYKDLKNLTKEEINQLCEEIREYIIDVTSKNGGHIGPSLGTVELTIALLMAFDPEIDRIVWDVGHQTYTYKILTGRKEQFKTLRQYKGISGFSKIKESKYDHFGTGHSSTSISAALGMRVAKDLKKEEGYTIAVIGDGAMTAGEAFEGLNNAGWLDPSKFIVILNDNQMSISPNVGALYTYFNKIITNQVFQKPRQKLKEITEKLLGKKAVRLLRKIEEYTKGLFAPGIIFEELGFTYVGTIDGHNLFDLEKTLQNIKQMRGPILLHVITQKGKGYKFAEENPVTFHGVSPFDKISGLSIKKSSLPTYSKIFGDALVELAEKDEKIVAITPAMKEGSGLVEFSKRFPDRFFDVAIAEQHASTFAAGLAKEGLKPVVAYYSTFMQRAYDQVIHDVALQELPVIFAIDRAGLVGDDGPTHHGVFDIAYLRPIPNIIISAPKDEQELRNLLYTAINSNKVFAIRYPRGNAVGVNIEDFEKIEIGSWELLEEGKEIAILAVGKYVQRALEVRKLLKLKGINPTIINARFIKPMDEKLLKITLNNHKYIVTMEDGVLNGGFSSAVAEFMADYGYTNILIRFGIPDRFIEHGKTELLEKDLGLLPEQMADRILNRLINTVKKEA
ncbi:1-deoxy-D-xylulose-5-phosphate synthase [Venenivibrio stagnispumantis]|uniref:1-deoxy-D-xylulose-5-phosphate synthase n=1 Tax=Venenivibrio stagnispumantis TaxID=407998 RepID=A0AA45WKP7_9AQUI|nr:1-deoxy-D-xylulose-5-phosphate synthase [Venenivibrio stagnispumantis]MCW4573010.1 1-deoxy-D-xylulose-5-phosphate synthase [Venenivibrio stagnispumantis]SMP07814.1 1-deoxy-D-xylulose-5-phosphate synthase [Venenivibrio stagnispumantis]